MNNSLNIKYGIIIALGFWAYFLAANIFGFAHVVALRGLNLFILLGGILLALREQRDSGKHSFKFSEGLLTGALTGITGVILFAVTMCIYLLVIDPEFMASIKANEPFGQYLNPFSVMVVIIVEGSASSVIGSLALIQIMKAKGKKRVAFDD